jgi:hypothetical protein
MTAPDPARSDASRVAEATPLMNEATKDRRMIESRVTLSQFDIYQAAGVWRPSFKHRLNAHGAPG